MNNVVKKNNIIGTIYLLLTALIWGSAFVAQFTGGTKVGNFTFIFLRTFIGSITIVFMIITSNFFKYKKIIFIKNIDNLKNTIFISFKCGVLLFFSMVFQQIGVTLTDTAKSGFIASLTVICVPFLLFVLYGKKIKLKTLFFIFTTIIGIGLISLNSTQGIDIGDILGIIAMFLYSISILQVTKYIKEVDALEFSLFRFLIVCIMSFIATFIFEKGNFNIENLKIGFYSFMYAGIFSTGVAYSFQIIGQKYCNPVIATLLMSLEGLFAAISGWIFLGHALNFLQIIGCVIMTISIILVQLTDN